MSQAPVITVVIPAHNPRIPVLGRVIAALQAQTLAPDSWSAVLVDNGSDPPLVPSAWTERLPNLAVVREPRLGLTYARTAGIAQATGSLVIFADDDNVLAADYLEKAREFMAAHPEVGACGGRIVGEFASSPPGWAKPHLELLALRDHGSAPLVSRHASASIAEFDYFAPLGAGLVVRTSVARAYAERIASGAAHFSDRQGSSLASAGDCEIVMQALAAGLQMAYSPDLNLVHVIPASRLTFSYLGRLNRASSQSWAEFLRRHGLARSIPPWTVPLRQMRSFFVSQAWTRSGFIRWRGRCGYFAGLAA